MGVHFIKNFRNSTVMIVLIYTPKYVSYQTMVTPSLLSMQLHSICGHSECHFLHVASPIQYGMSCSI